MNFRSDNVTGVAPEILDALAAGGIKRFIVVVGYHADDVKRELSERPGVSFAHSM